MTTTINASPTNGLVQTADGSGVLKVQSNGVTTNALAWVNFNGTGTVAIRSSYNVSSITDNGTGDYTVNFATALADANYSVCATSTQNRIAGFQGTTPTTTAYRLTVQPPSGALSDESYIFVQVFGN
jgi:hypothetical protein